MRTNVTINSVEHQWIDTERVTYEEVVRAALPEADVSQVWTVVYFYPSGLGGLLTAGESISLVERMVFDVAMTDNA